MKSVKKVSTRERQLFELRGLRLSVTQLRAENKAATQVLNEATAESARQIEDWAKDSSGEHQAAPDNELSGALDLTPSQQQRPGWRALMILSVSSGMLAVLALAISALVLWRSFP